MSKLINKLKNPSGKKGNWVSGKLD